MLKRIVEWNKCYLRAAVISLRKHEMSFYFFVAVDQGRDNDVIAVVLLW